MKSLIRFAYSNLGVGESMREERLVSLNQKIMKKDYNQVVGRLEDGFALENQCFSYSKSTRFACMRTMANEL